MGLLCYGWAIPHLIRLFLLIIFFWLPLEIPIECKLGSYRWSFDHVFGLGAMLFALDDINTIFWFALFSLAGLGASFGTIILFNVYYKKTSLKGVVGGILTGFLTTII